MRSGISMFSSRGLIGRSPPAHAQLAPTCLLGCRFRACAVGCKPRRSLNRKADMLLGHCGRIYYFWNKQRRSKSDFWFLMFLHFTGLLCSLVTSKTRDLSTFLTRDRNYFLSVWNSEGEVFFFCFFFRRFFAAVRVIMDSGLGSSQLYNFTDYYYCYYWLDPQPLSDSGCPF